MDETHHSTAPDWVPEGMEDDPHFACRLMPGVITPPPDALTRKPAKRRKLTLDDYERGVLAGDTSILSRAITLVESNHPAHEAMAQELLTRLLPKTGNSIRIGITGVPGAGKSTLIESLGCQLCEKGHRVAVLAVDPSSTRTAPERTLPKSSSLRRSVLASWMKAISASGMPRATSLAFRSS